MELLWRWKSFGQFKKKKSLRILICALSLCPVCILSLLMAYIIWHISNKDFIWKWTLGFIISHQCVDNKDNTIYLCSSNFLRALEYMDACSIFLFKMNETFAFEYLSSCFHSWIETTSLLYLDSLVLR